MTRKLLLPVLALAAVLTGCAEITWEEKLEALRHAGERGAETHYVLLNKNEEPTRETCKENYSLAVGRDNDPPEEFDERSPSEEWRNLHLDYFVDSCVSGVARKPTTRPTTTRPTTVPSSATTSSTPPSTGR